MKMTMVNVGEDDGCGTGESGIDGSSGNSDWVRKQACQASTPTINSKLAMTRQFAGYGTLQSAKLAQSSDDASKASWKTNVKKWNSQMRQILTPRSGWKVKKKHLRDPHHHFRSKPHAWTEREESEDDSETSNSSSNSSNNSNSSTKSMANIKRSSGEAGRWYLQAKRTNATCTSHEITEEVLLLQSFHHNLEAGIKKVESDVLPDIKTELFKLLKLANPVIFTYVLEFFPALVSMTLVGHLDSPLTKQYLDGVALSTMVLNLSAIGLGFGLATAMDTLCSQAYGAGKPKKLGIYLQSGLIVLGLTLIPVFVINWYTEAFLLFIGQPAQVSALAGRFSQILLSGVPAIYVYELLKKVMQAQNVVLPMVYIAVISNMVNLVLGVYLTFYTSLGFDGTAIARLMSELLLLVCLIPYFIRNPHIPAEWWSGWHAKEAVENLGLFLKLGIPGAAMLLFEWVSFEIMAAIVGWLPNSVVAISVHSVLVNVSTFAYNFFLGISVAVNVLVGMYLGSNKPQYAKMASMLGLLLAVSLSALLATVLCATRFYIPEIFINDPVSIKLAGQAMLFLLPYQMCDAFNAVMQGVLRGTGRLTLGAYINLVSYFVLGLPLGSYLAFSMEMGVAGMWSGLTVGMLSGCVVSFIKICETDWKSMADAARVRTS